jgi:Txe/YoeB family toxin of toxin-antitoxin system
MIKRIGATLNVHDCFYCQSQQDIEKIKNSNFVKKTIGILELLENNPYQNPPPYEKLIGNLAGAYSRRINIKQQGSVPSDRGRKNRKNT